MTLAARRDAHLTARLDHPGIGERRSAGSGMALHTIRITYVRRADRYRIDEMVDDVVHTELVEAVFDEAFAEHLAELVANFRQIDVSRRAIDDDGVVLEWERCLRCEKRACLEATIAGRCLDHDVPDHVFSDVPAPLSARRGAVVLQRRPARRARDRRGGHAA